MNDNRQQIVEDIKADLHDYDEAFTSQGMIETLDVAVPFLQCVVDSDQLSEDLLRAVLGDPISAKNITKALDKYVGKHYIDNTMLEIEAETGENDEH